MELTQLGALKTLLREVLASSRNSSAAAANAQCAANAATAAVEAVAALRRAMDTQLQAAPSPASAATSAAASGSAIPSGKTVGESRPGPAHSSCERPLSRLTRREEGAHDRSCTAEGWGKNDSFRVTTHLLSLQATSLEAGSSNGFSTASTTAVSAPVTMLASGDASAPDTSSGEDVLAARDLAWAATLAGADAKQDPPSGQSANGAQAARALAVQDRPGAMPEDIGLTGCSTSARLSPNSFRLDAAPRVSGRVEAELGLLMAAAMQPTRGEPKRLWAVSTLLDVRSSFHRDHVSSSAVAHYASPTPPPSLP